MRHSDPSLTANVYTDPRLLDISGALDALPNLPIDRRPETKKELNADVAIGVRDRTSVALPVALDVARPSDNPRQTVCIAGQTSIEAPEVVRLADVALTGTDDKGSGAVTIGDKRWRGVETTGIEPATSWLQTRRSPIELPFSCGRMVERPAGSRRERDNSSVFG